MEDFTSYGDLTEMGFSSSQPVAPEDEFFHSIYIPKESRENHIQIMEESGKLQIRGVDYNKDEVYMIISHVKQRLIKNEKDASGKDKVACFSFKSGNPPWTSASGKQCGKNSAERAADPFCKDCRDQIVVAGIYCEPSGKPIMGKNGKPVFVFIVAKGMKYSKVSEYLGEMSRLEGLDPIFTPETDESTRFEKMVVNNKRFVTRITKEEATSRWGKQNIFNLTRTVALPKDTVMNILKISKQTMGKFTEKFDWSKNQFSSSSPSGYTDTVDQSQKFGDMSSQQVQPQTPSNNQQVQSKTKTQPDPAPYDFSNIDF